MTNIRLEMNYYTCAKEWAVIVLYNDAEGESASLNWYFKSKSKASKQMTALEGQYQVKGTVNEQ